MSREPEWITGEFRRVYDERYRIALPPECVEPIAPEGGECVLAKEREGCLSLWNEELWKRRIQEPIELIKHKLRLEYVQQDLAKIQRFTRLLSTRSRQMKLGQRGRLLVPEGFREFLDVAPGSEVILVGAGVCLELWNPEVWRNYLREDIGEFHALFKELIS